ncbi:ER lumen protein retaining receptor [Ramicandelaber brevisporus]|nr:ER lumen protein retaining receptor [Ramicandelaber brevisporus]
MLNAIRVLADMLHLASYLILIYKMRASKSVAGISLKTQALYLLVFVTRYIDLPFRFALNYNTPLKIIFIGAAGYIVYLMLTEYRSTYDAAFDTFRVEFLILAALLASLVYPDRYEFIDGYVWSFSIYLEATAILPQLFQMTRTGEAETITAHYLFCLGSYRALYIINWIYRYATEPGYSDPVAWIAGVVQTLLYADFFYVYFTKVLKTRRYKMPV